MASNDELKERVRRQVQVMQAISSKSSAKVSDPMAVDRSYVQQKPDGFQEMTDIDKAFKKVGDIGEAIYGLSGFSPNWQKTKEDFTSGTLTARQALKTAGSFLLSLPLGMASAPFSGAEKFYEAATGRPTQEAIDDYYMPDYTLSDEQKRAAGIDALIDYVGLGLGGSGSLLRGAAGTLRGAKTAGAAFSAARAQKPLAGVWTKPAKEAVERAKLAGRPQAEIDQLEKVFKAGRRKETAIGLTYDMAEEGGEEYAQSLLEDIRGTQEKHGLDEDSQSKAVEAAILGALGGLIFGGFTDAASRVVEGAHSLGAKSAVQKAKQNTDWLSRVDEKNEDILATVRQEIEADKAILKSEPSSGQAVGQMWVPPKGHDASATNLGLNPLLKAAFKEQGQDPAHAFTPVNDFFQGFQYNYNGQTLNFLETLDGMARRARDAAGNDRAAFEQAVDAEANNVTAAINNYLDQQRQQGRRLRLAVSKNPGDKIAFVDAYVARVNPGETIALSNILDVSINADVDGDNYTFFFLDNDGKSASGAPFRKGSVWQSISEMATADTSLTGAKWEKKYKQNIDKAKMQMAITNNFTAATNVLSRLYSELSADAKQEISQTEYNSLVNDICDSLRLPVTDQRTVNARARLMDEKHKTAPFRDVFSMFGWLNNNIANNAEQRMSELWDALTTDTAQTTSVDRVSELECATGATVVTNDLQYREELNADIRGSKVLTAPSQTGVLNDRENIINAIVDMFGAPQNVFASPTRENLTFYQMVKSYTRHTVDLLAQTIPDSVKLKEQAVENVFSYLVRQHLNIAAVGEHPLEFPSTLARAMAFEKARADTKVNGTAAQKVTFTGYEDVMSWCEAELKSKWQEEKRRWDKIKVQVYGNTELSSLDAAIFPEWKDSDALYNWYSCVKEKAASDIFSGTTLNRTMESYVAEIVNTGSDRNVRTENGQIRRLLNEIAKSVIAKNNKDQTILESNIKKHIADNAQMLNRMAATGWNWSEIERSPELGAFIQYLSGLGGITRKNDLRSISLLSVQRFVAAAKEDQTGITGKIARGLMSADSYTVLSSASALASYNVFYKPNVTVENGTINGLERKDSVGYCCEQILNGKPQNNQLVPLTDNEVLRHRETILEGLAQMASESPLYAKIATHYFAQLRREDVSVSTIKSIAKDLFLTAEILSDPERSLSEKEGHVATILGLEDYQNFWIDSIGKERDMTDITTPTSRFSQVETFFNSAAQLNLEYTKASADAFMTYLNRADTANVETTFARLGKLHELQGLSGTDGMLSYVADNIQRGMLSRWRKTENTPASGQMWKASSRAKMGIVPSEAANVAYMAGVMDWKYIEASPGVFGQMLFTDYLEKNFPFSLKVNMPNGEHLYLRNKQDLIRALMSEENAARLLPRDRDGEFHWTAEIAQAILDYNPALINVFNPIVYSTMENNGASIEKPAHRFEIRGYQLDESDNLDAAGRRQANVNNSFFAQLQDSNFSNLQMQVLDAKISNSLFKNQDGMFLFAATIPSAVFEESQSYDQISYQCNQVRKIWQAAAKAYAIEQNPAEREKIISGFLLGTNEEARYIINAEASTLETIGAFGQFVQSIKEGTVSANQVFLEGITNAIFNTPGGLSAGLSNAIGTLQANAQGIVTRGADLLYGIDELYSASLLSQLLGDFDRSSNGPRYINRGDLVSVWNRFLDDQIRVADENLAQGNVSNNAQQVQLAQVLRDRLVLLKNFSQAGKVRPAKGAKNLGALFDLGPFVMALDEAFVNPSDESMQALRGYVTEIEGRFNNPERTIASLMAGVDSSSPVTTSQLNDLLDPAKMAGKTPEEIANERRTFVRNVLVGKISSLGSNVTSMVSLEQRVRGTLNDCAKSLSGDNLSSEWMTDEDRRLVEEIKSGKISLGITTANHRAFAQQFIGETSSGNAGTGVSLNASLRPSLLSTLDLPTHMRNGGVFTGAQGMLDNGLSFEMYSPQYWAGKTKAEFYRFLSQLSEDERQFAVGTYEDTNGNMHNLTPFAVDSWANDNTTLGAVYMLNAPNAGFDERYNVPSVSGNPNYRGLHFMLGTFLLNCAEAMNLKSKKKSNIYKDYTYALEDEKSRKELQNLQSLSAQQVLDPNAVNMSVRKFKNAYAKALYDLYNTDDGHKEVGFSKPMWYMLANHVVQKIMVRTNDGQIIAIPYVEFVDGSVANNPVFAQLQNNVAEAWIDVMSIEEIGSSLQNEISKQRQLNRGTIGRGTNANGQLETAADVNTRNRAWTTAAFDEFRRSQPDENAARLALSRSISSVSIAPRRTVLISTPDIREGGKPHRVRTSVRNAEKAAAIADAISKRNTKKSGRGTPLFVQIFGQDITEENARIKREIDGLIDSDWHQKFFETPSVKGRPISVLVKASASDVDIMNALKLSSETGVYVTFESNKQYGETMAKASEYGTLLETSSAHGLYSLRVIPFSNVEETNFIAPRVARGDKFVLGIFSPFIHAQDGHGEISSADQYLSQTPIFEEENFDQIMNGPVLTPAEVNNLLIEKGVTAPQPGHLLTEGDMASLNINASDKNVLGSSGASYQGSYLRAISNYVANIDLLQGNNLAFDLTPNDGLVCVGFARRREGSDILEPIMVGPVSIHDTLSITYDERNKNKLGVHKIQSAKGSFNRGGSQKFYVQLGGVKVEVNMPSKLGVTSEADHHSLFTQASNRAFNGGTIYMDVSNNGGKTPGNDQTNFALFYYWMKNTDTAYNLFIDPDTRQIKQGVVNNGLAPDVFRAYVTDYKYNRELCSAILQGKISFNFFADPKQRAQFDRVIGAFARRCLATNTNLLEIVSNFSLRNTNNSQDVSSWEMISMDSMPHALSCLPNGLNENDIAILFHAISPKLVSLNLSNDIDVIRATQNGGELPRFTRDGQILTFYNGKPTYMLAALDQATYDSRNSVFDNFEARAKVGEKPDTLLAFFNGIDDNADYDQMRMEAALASGSNLTEVSAYYAKNKVNTTKELLRSQDLRNIRKASYFAGMEDLVSESEKSDLDNLIASLHKADLRGAKERFFRNHISIITADRSNPGIWEDQQMRRDLGRIKAKFNTSSWTDQDAVDFQNWVESLVKRALGYAPGNNNKNDERDGFTEKQLRKAIDFIERSLDDGYLFDMSKLGVGSTDFIIDRSGANDVRYVVPIVTNEDERWINDLKNGVSYATQLDKSASDCNTLIEALNTSGGKTVQKKAVLNMIESLAMDAYPRDAINTGWAKGADYIITLLRENQDIVAEMGGGELLADIAAMSRENQQILEAKLEKMTSRGMRSVESAYFANGKMATESGKIDDSIERVLNNLCEMAKLMKIAEPMLLPASVIERQVYTRPTDFMVTMGMLGSVSPYQSQVNEKFSTTGGKNGTKRWLKFSRATSYRNDVKQVFNQFKLLNMYGTTDFMMEDLKNQSDIISYLASKKNDPNLLTKLSNTAYDWAAGKGIGSRIQVHLFFNNLIRLMSLDKRFDWYFQPSRNSTAENPITNIEEIIAADPAKFFLSCFATDSDLNFVAKQAYNVSLQGDAAAKTIWSVMYYETCAQHPAFRAMNTIFFSPFVQYGFNIANRHLNSIAPISTLNYLLVSLGAKSDLRIPWLKSQGETMRLKDLNLEDAQVAASLKEAMQIDISRMGTMFFAMLLVSMSGALQPPDDPDKWGNIDEWLIFGNRIQMNWWVQDILGPALGYAAALVSVQMGKPCPDVFYNNLLSCLYADPLMRASDGINLLFNPYGQYMEEYYNDIERFSNTKDSQPTPLEVFGADLAVGTMSTLFSFITPAIVRDIYRESQEYEVSYKNVYKTDQYGNILYDENGMPVGTEKATYLDQKIRKATRSNPFFALAMDAIRGGKGTGYLASEMPRTVYYDPEQLSSYQALSLYYVDEYGNTVQKSEQECQAIAMSIINTLLSYDDMDALASTGFCMPIETIRYVDDIVWDIYYNQKELYKQMQDNGNLDPAILGGGDYELGKAVLDGLDKEFDNLYQFWSDFHYNKLWSDQMKAGIQKYNRWATSYAPDANGDYYATGFRRGITNLVMPWKTAEGTLEDPAQTLGYYEDWNSPSAVTGNSLGGRVLVPVPDTNLKVPSFDSLASDGNGGGYSNSYPKYMKAYSSGGGGGRTSTYTAHPNISLPYLRSPNLDGPVRPNSGTRATSNIDLTMMYIRPQFETKGSRQAYRREDI